MTINPSLCAENIASTANCSWLSSAGSIAFWFCISKDVGWFCGRRPSGVGAVRPSRYRDDSDDEVEEVEEVEGRDPLEVVDPCRSRREGAGSGNLDLI